MITDPDAIRVLCFGDSNTYGTPGDDPEYVRLTADRRWTGRLQRLLGDGYDVVEEGLNGRTTDLDYVDRPGCNGRTYWAPCLQTHHPLDVVVVMLGVNDLKSCFDRTPQAIAAALHGYVGDIADNADRLVRLGVARSIAAPSYEADTVARELARLLEDGSYRSRAKDAATQVARDGGAAAAADAIEAVLRGAA